MRVSFEHRPPQAHPVPLVCVHGWLGDGHDFAELARSPRLANRHILAIDLPGHGPSPRRVPASFDASVEALAKALPKEPIDGLGYSMGGRLLWAAAARDLAPQLRRTIIVSAHPGLEEESARVARLADDEARAATLEQPSFDVASFLDTWYRLPLFGALREAQVYDRLLAHRRQGDPRGWAAALRTHSLAHQPYLPGLGHHGSLRLICGSKDTKYAALYVALAQRGLDVTQVSGAAHAPHVEQPLAFARIVASILDHAS